MKKQLKCYIYTRVSTSMQVDGYSLDAQKDKLHKYADYQDMHIVGEYSDEGKSGKSVEGRPQDMNNRLNKIYEEIYNIEDMIIDCEKKKEATKQDVLTKENVFKMLLVFDKIFDKMNDADKRKLLESMIAEVHLHPKDTWQEGKNPIKEIKYAFPVSQEVMEALRENVASVETVVLLSKGMVDSRKDCILDAYRSGHCRKQPYPCDACCRQYV